jgi:glutamine amidotransferase
MGYQSIGVVGLRHSNFRSVERAFNFLGLSVQIVKDKSSIAKLTHIVVPGVAAFGTVVSELKEMNLFQDIRDLYGSKIKILGLCAGMQIMGHSSVESPGHFGFSWFNWQCSPFLSEDKKRVFHTGWNSITKTYGEGLCKELINNDFYFNHSFYVTGRESLYTDCALSSFNNQQILSVIESKNVWGIQFHPEKSQTSGLRVLSKFASWE